MLLACSASPGRARSHPLTSATVTHPHATSPPPNRGCDSTSSCATVACARGRPSECSADCTSCCTSSAPRTVRCTAPIIRDPR
eukprot:scaffold80059_cov63-Phaeocystis_antarctica.AAC.2